MPTLNLYTRKYRENTTINLNRTSCWRALLTLSVVLLFLGALLRLDVLRGAATLRLLVVMALIEDVGQVGSVNLPELLIVIESGAQVPVFTWSTTNNTIHDTW